MRLSAPIFVLAGLPALLFPSTLFAEWEISQPLEDEVLSEDTNITATGGSLNGISQVTLKLRKQNAGGTYVTLETIVVMTSGNLGGTWSHNFGKKSSGEYQIILYTSTGVSKDDVSFVVEGPPE